jgi:chemotaxis protein MotB
MAGREKKMEEEAGTDPNGWMVTFSDLIMLLLTFFIMLLIMSSMDTRELKNLSTHFKEATGVLEFSGSRAISNLAEFVQKYNESESMLVMDQNFFNDVSLRTIKGDESLEGKTQDPHELIEISDDERGMVFSIQGTLLFDPGEAHIKKEFYPFLDKIARAIEECSNEILIMGSTDNIPIQSKRYKSNWELSIYRGLSVLEYFLGKKKISPSRFSVGGYGPSRPLALGHTPENRALSRKVEIIFKHLKGE